MHELSLAMALVKEVERIKAEEKASKVLSVTVTVGALSGVDCESLRFVFPLAAEGTGLEGTELEIRQVPAAVQCGDCGKETEPQTPFFRCDRCGSTQVTITKGREFLIQSVQVQCDEDGENDHV